MTVPDEAVDHGSVGSDVIRSPLKAWTIWPIAETVEELLRRSAIFSTLRVACRGTRAEVNYAACANGMLTL
jgi:hypothetical protein